MERWNLHPAIHVSSHVVLNLRSQYIPLSRTRGAVGASSEEPRVVAELDPPEWLVVEYAQAPYSANQCESIKQNNHSWDVLTSIHSDGF